jgi:hypothetical protein
MPLPLDFHMVKFQNFFLTFFRLKNFVIPVLARQSASARRREDGNPETMKSKYWIPAGVYPVLNTGQE